MATKKVVDSFSPEDFESWDEAAEQAAIAAAAAAVEVKYIIIEGKVFVARFPDGEIVKVPIKVSLNDISAITTETSNELEQVKSLLQILGQDDDLEVLGNEDILAVTDFAAKYFRVFEKISQVALGE